MTFETRRIALAAGDAPIDLASDADFGLSESGVLRANAAIQNVGTRIARFAEVEVAPSGTAEDVGHVLRGGDGIVVSLVFGRPFWLWSSTGAVVAVSEGGSSLVRAG